MAPSGQTAFVKLKTEHWTKLKLIGGIYSFSYPEEDDHIDSCVCLVNETPTRVS